MDDYEVPAFLRKQADDATSYGRQRAPDDAGMTPAEFSNWLNTHAASHWPMSFDALRDLGLSLAICEWLELDVGQGREEAAVVRAFIAAVLGFKYSDASGIRKAVQAIKGVIQAEKQSVDDPELTAAIRVGLQGVQASKWPDSVANFPANQLA
jgi:hypothetical protein